MKSFPVRTVEQILKQSHTIASIGVSPSNKQVANRVSRILQYWGYTVIPVNPNFEIIFNTKSYPDLLQAPRPIDIVLIFRRSENILPHVEEAISIGASVVWMPLAVINQEAAAKAKAAGLDVVMDRCIECAAVGLGIYPRHKLED